MFTDGAITLDLDFIKFHLNDNAYVNERFMKLYVCITAFVGGLICLLIYYISTLCCKILSPMKEGRPFEPSVSMDLRKIAWGILIGGLIAEGLGIVARILLTKAYTLNELFTSDAISKTEYLYIMNLDFVFIACIILFLSYIFSYGQILQQDSDETL